MSALIIAAHEDEKTLNRRLVQQFDDYELVVVKPSGFLLYQNANNIVRYARQHNGPIFVVLNERGLLFFALVVGKLAKVIKIFRVMAWNGRRFRVLRVP